MTGAFRTFFVEQPAMSEALPGQPPATRFPTTCWSRVVAAGGRATPEDREALAELCRAYWYPLYA